MPKRLRNALVAAAGGCVLMVHGVATENVVEVVIGTLVCLFADTVVYAVCDRWRTWRRRGEIEE